MTLGELLPYINCYEDVKLQLYFSDGNFDTAYEGSVLSIPWVYMENNLYNCANFESISSEKDENENTYLEIAIEDN